MELKKCLHRVRTGLWPVCLLVAIAGLLANDLLAQTSGTPGNSSQGKKPPFLPVIAVQAAYSGASAQDVADMVARPIEIHVFGVDGLLHLRSVCGDGTYTLHATFKKDADLRVAQVLVQKRVALALPGLPAAVSDGGVTVRLKAPGVAMIVTLSSPKGRYGAAHRTRGSTRDHPENQRRRRPGPPERRGPGRVGPGVAVPTT